MVDQDMQSHRLDQDGTTEHILPRSPESVVMLSDDSTHDASGCVRLRIRESQLIHIAHDSALRTAVILLSPAAIWDENLRADKAAIVRCAGLYLATPSDIKNSV